MSDDSDPSRPGRPSNGAPRPDYGGEPDRDEAELRGDYRSRSEQFRRTADEAATKMRGAAEKAQEQTRVHMDSARATIGESDDRTLTVAAYILFLTAGVTGGLGAIVGVILAYVKKGTPNAVLASHLEFQIRTFWIGLAVGLIGLVLTIIWVGVLVLIALGVWWLLRSAVGLIRLLEDKPMRDPHSWLL
jgi:uncharacterized membrane protein